MHDVVNLQSNSNQCSLATRLDLELVKLFHRNENPFLELLQRSARRVPTTLNQEWDLMFVGELDRSNDVCFGRGGDDGAWEGGIVDVYVERPAQEGIERGSFGECYGGGGGEQEREGSEVNGFWGMVAFMGDDCYRGEEV